MNSHNFKMIAGLVVIAFIGGLQALHGTVGTNTSVWIDLIVSVLLIIEHKINGNSEAM